MTDTCSLAAEELPARRDAFLALIDDALVRAERECCRSWTSA